MMVNEPPPTPRRLSQTEAEMVLCSALCDLGREGEVYASDVSTWWTEVREAVEGSPKLSVALARMLAARGYVLCRREEAFDDQPPTEADLRPVTAQEAIANAERHLRIRDLIAKGRAMDVEAWNAFHHDVVDQMRRALDRWESIAASIDPITAKINLSIVVEGYGRFSDSVEVTAELADDEDDE